jgi:two-component system response regulator
MDTKTILLVEDDRDDRDLIRMALRKAATPCEVEVMEDGTEIIDYLFGTGQYATRDLRTMPHLILLDLKMPRLNGRKLLQALRRVRGKSHLPPVVVFTSSDEEHDIAEAYRVGANSYVRKPVDADQFQETIRELVTYWITMNHAAPMRRPTFRERSNSVV